MQYSNKLFRQQAIDNLYKESVDAAMLAPKSHYLVITSLLVLIILALIVLLATGRYAQKAKVQGYLIASQPSISVVPPELGGSITELLVQDGEQVKAGQTLALVSRRQGVLAGEGNYSQLREELAQKVALAEDNHHLQAEQLTQSITLLRQAAQTVKRKQGLLTQSQQQLATQIHTQTQQLASLTVLHKQNYVSEAQINAQQTTLDALTDSALGYQRNQVDLIQQARSIQQDIQQTQSTIRQQANQYQQQQNEFTQQGRALAQQQHYAITAPITGKVQSLQVHTGMDLAKVSTLMKIRPASATLFAKIYVPSSAGGFVRSGQQVNIRLNAFPYQQFGTLRATIAQLSDTLLLPTELTNAPIQSNQAVFMAQARLSEQQLRGQIALKDGLSFEADILLWDRTLWQWLMSPLYQLKEAI